MASIIFSLGFIEYFSIVSEEQSNVILVVLVNVLFNSTLFRSMACKPV